MFCFRYGILREVVSFSSDKVLVSGVTYILTFVYILCLLITYFIGESVQSHPVLLFEALFLFILLVINFLLALNEEYLYRNEIPLRAKKVLGMSHFFYFYYFISPDIESFNKMIS